MKIDISKRGLNKDECFCGSKKDIKAMLNTLSLDDNYKAEIYLGLCRSWCYDGVKPIFQFEYASHPYKIISRDHDGPTLWFSFYSIKAKEITEEIKEEFKCKIIPMIKEEITICLKRNTLISFRSFIKVSIENKKLVIERKII